jgi:hypothetical protein
LKGIGNKVVATATYGKTTVLAECETASFELEAWATVLSGGYQLWQEFSCAVDAWATVPSGGYQLWQEFSCAVDAGATVPSGVY